VRAVSIANGFPQVQMDNASYCPDRTLHAHDRELGKEFHVRFSCHLLTAVPSRLSGEDSILLNTLAPSSLGTTSENLHSMCISSLAFSTSWASIQVGATALPAPPLRD
jgi:hypothetical protein